MPSQPGAMYSERPGFQVGEAVARAETVAGLRAPARLCVEYPPMLAFCAPPTRIEVVMSHPRVRPSPCATKPPISRVWASLTDPSSLVIPRVLPSSERSETHPSRIRFRHRIDAEKGMRVTYPGCVWRALWAVNPRFAVVVIHDNNLWP